MVVEVPRALRLWKRPFSLEVLAECDPLSFPTVRLAYFSHKRSRGVDF
jgi:hypothetical protein